MFVLVSLALACATSPETKPTPATPSAPVEDPTGGATTETTSGGGTVDNPTDEGEQPLEIGVMGPSWGDGPIEIWSGSDMVGVAYVEVSGGVRTEHIAMFAGSLSANNNTRWDLTLDGLESYPAFAPTQGAGVPTGSLTIKTFVRCSAKNTCTSCQTGCYSSFTQFKNDVWGDIAERIGKSTTDVANLSKNYAVTAPYSTSTFSTSACNAPSVNEYSPPRNNGLQKNGSAIGWVHQGISTTDASKRILRQAIDSRDGSIPHGSGTFTQNVSWPPASGGGQGPWGLAAWCTNVGNWCSNLPAGVTCDYTEMTMSYPASW